MNHYTKGPWKLSIDADHICIVNCAPYPATLAEVYTSKGKYLIDRDEALANSRLMASAPDLIQENERLKYRIYEMENCNHDSALINSLRDEIEKLKEKNKRLQIESSDLS